MRPGTTPDDKDAAVTTIDEPPAAAARVRPLRVALTAILCAAVVALLVWQRHRFAGLPGLLANANWAWVALAIMAQVISVGALAREQRRLISVRGGQRSLPSVLATVYAGNAISLSLPLVGSAAAAVFAYRRFTLIGVDRTVAAWALAISGVYSSVSFAGIAALGAILSGSTGLAITGLVTAVGVVIPIIFLFAGLRRPRVKQLATTAVTTVLTVARKVIRRPSGDPAVISAGILDQLTSLRLTPHSAVVATAMAVLNWTADLLCLTCALMAIHAHVPWQGIVLAWAAGAGASSLNLTPGGLGVVEITLGAALIAAGIPAGAAVAAALLYRAVKLGLILAVGGVTLLIISHITPPEQINSL
jgi:uncharacterized protein (TIRG00374 family)